MNLIWVRRGSGDGRGEGGVEREEGRGEWSGDGRGERDKSEGCKIMKICKKLIS